MAKNSFLIPTQSNMGKNAKKLTWILLIFGLLGPKEILGQYAIPSINPQISSENPSIIPWKTKSSFSVGYKTTEGEYAEDKIASQKGFIQHGLLSIAGKYEGRNVRTGFEIISKKRKTRKRK